jgi:uncharacterized protein YegL
MSNSPASPFSAVEFADNPEPRCPCVLVLDTSGSMSGAPITALNWAIQGYKAELEKDSLAAKRVEVAVITCGGDVRVMADFATVRDFLPPAMAADGNTPLGEAVTKAIELLEARKEEYRANGIAFYRPWIFVITDGAPTDAWLAAADRVRTGEQNKSFMLFAVGVDGADMDLLAKLSVRQPLLLSGLKFKELFQWLSASQRAVSRSRTGDEVQLPNPAGPNGWTNLN